MSFDFSFLSSCVPLPSPLPFVIFLLMVHSPDIFFFLLQKIMQYFSLRDGLFCMPLLEQLDDSL